MPWNISRAVGGDVKEPKRSYHQPLSSLSPSPTSCEHELKTRASLEAQVVKDLPAMQENPGSISGLGRSPGEGHGNPLRYSSLENPMDRGA